MFTIAELSMMIEALEALEMEYREIPERRALIERLRAAREALRAEACRY
jgi:hypothetical protein